MLSRHVGSTRNRPPTRHAIEMEVAPVPAVQKILTRIVPVAALTAGLLVASPAAEAAHKAAKKEPVATIALGDKRPKKVRVASKKVKANAMQYSTN